MSMVRAARDACWFMHLGVMPLQMRDSITLTQEQQQRQPKPLQYCALLPSHATSAPCLHCARLHRVSAASCTMRALQEADARGRVFEFVAARQPASTSSEESTAEEAAADAAAAASEADAKHASLLDEVRAAEAKLAEIDAALQVRRLGVLRLACCPMRGASGVNLWQRFRLISAACRCLRFEARMLCPTDSLAWRTHEVRVPCAGLHHAP